MIQKLNEYIRTGMSRIKREHVKHNVKQSIITILLFIAAVSVIAFILSVEGRGRVLANDIAPGYTSIYDVNKQPVVLGRDTAFNGSFPAAQSAAASPSGKNENKNISSIILKKQNKTSNKEKKKSGVEQKQPSPKDTSSFKQYGVASHMGSGLQGRTQASGEKHDKNKLICAHRTLPFGTVIKVTNKSNNKSVNVVVTDRGPYVSGRIVDLSLAAADKIGIKDAGVANVEVVKIK